MLTSLQSFGATFYPMNKNSKIVVFVIFYLLFSREYFNKLTWYTQIFVLSTTLPPPPNKETG